MQVRRTTLHTLLSIAFVVSFSLVANAGVYTAVISYGDSLSDNGNLYAVTGLPPYPYWNGHFSNGPVAVEYLAGSLNAPLYDFAWGGATTGMGNYLDGGNQTTMVSLPGMIPEVAGSLPSVTPFAPTSLFVVWGGANDFFLTPHGSVGVAVGDMLWIVNQLQSAGAKHILVPGLPDLGLTPAYYGDPTATAWSLAFNQALQGNLPKGVVYFDTFGFMHKVVADPAAFGFTDVVDPCFNGVTVCSNPDEYLFWDNVHPTTEADQILSAEFAGAVPEPSTLLMMGTAAVGLAGVLRRKLF